MARVIIDEEGTKRYYGSNGNRHREDGPAVIYLDGAKYYYINESYANSYEINEPDVQSNGEKIWYSSEDDDFLSIGRPARDFPSGFKRWYKGGCLIWPEL